MWKNRYFFIKNHFGKTQCLICRRVLARGHNFTVARHYNSRHIHYDKIINCERQNLIDKLKREILNKNQEVGPKNSCENQIAKATYVVSIALAKQCRPYEDGMFVKTVCQNILMCFGESGEEYSKLIEAIPLSRQTIVRRTEEVGKYLYSEVKQRLQECLFFSLSLDESTDICNVSQVVIFVKTVHENLKTYEDFLAVVPMHGHVTGEALWQVVNEQLFAYVDKNKLSAVCTDGAKVMVGNSRGLVGILKKHKIDVPSYHCIIHQQALLGKNITVFTTMKIAVEIINKIKGGHNALTHRKFKSFLKELEADYGDLLLFTEVRWLSRGRSLSRLFDLREEVADFLTNHQSEVCQNLAAHLNDKIFILNLAFLCDISMLLNDLNLYLQGKNKQIFHLLPAIKRFSHKLCVLKQEISTKNLKSIPKTSIVFSELDANVLAQYIDILDSLLENIQMRFKDFANLENAIDLYNNDLSCDLQKQNTAVQEELKAMHSDITIPFATHDEFWRQISRIKYPNATAEIYKLYSMFGTTYNCESAFSILKLIKNKFRSTISDKHLEDMMRIKIYDNEIDIEKILEQRGRES